MMAFDGSITQFIEKYNIDRSFVSALSETAQRAWENRHHNLYFMRRFYIFDQDKEAQDTLNKSIGIYRMYRRHSVLPGFLLEFIEVKEYNIGYCGGIYHQYNIDGGVNKIEFNLFYMGFYLIAFGAHPKESNKDEIITVTVLKDSVPGVKSQKTRENNENFIGILTGIYDIDHVLLAERVLIEKVNSAESARDLSFLPMHISPEDIRGNYNLTRIRNIVDNDIDGQTLTARRSRLEYMSLFRT